MADPQPHQFLIQMSGYPGSGKSTLAKSLSCKISGVVIDHDVNKSAILDSGHSWQLASKLAYGVGWEMAGYFLNSGLSVVIDSACFYPEIVKSGQELAMEYGAEYWYVECRVDDTSILENRLQTRISHRSQRTAMHRLPTDAGTSVIGDPVALFTKEPNRPDKNCIVVDCSGEKEAALVEIMKLIRPEA